MPNLTRLMHTRLKVAGAAFALSAGLVACGGTTTTTPTTTTGLYPVTVTFTGISGAQNVVVTYPNNSTGTFTMLSGGIINLPAGTYTITGPTVTGKTTPAAQTVTLSSSNASQTVTFAY